MLNDLLDAQAAIDWAVAQLPTLQARVEAWSNGPRYKLIFHPNKQLGKKIIKLAEVQSIDSIINAEVGAIINSIRSSLDILITSIALRHGYTNTERTYFPIARDRAQFLSFAGYKGCEAIKALPDRERSIIENLEPWRGGNATLVALHDLDIIRKHQRLIDVRVTPWAIVISPEDYRNGLEFAPVWRGFKNDAVIGWTGINAPDCNPQISLQIEFDETLPGSNKSLLATLRDFASLAHSIINIFDTLIGDE